MRDQKDMMRLKQSALDGNNGKHEGEENRAVEGYPLWQLLVIAIVSLIIGALIRSS